eukprot:364071-Chlamydomonas_euryale.AAC.3
MLLPNTLGMLQHHASWYAVVQHSLQAADKAVHQHFKHASWYAAAQHPLKAASCAADQHFKHASWYAAAAQHSLKAASCAANQHKSYATSQQLHDAATQHSAYNALYMLPTHMGAENGRNGDEACASDVNRRRAWRAYAAACEQPGAEGGRGEPMRSHPDSTVLGAASTRVWRLARQVLHKSELVLVHCHERHAARSHGCKSCHTVALGNKAQQNQVLAHRPVLLKCTRARSPRAANGRTEALGTTDSQKMWLRTTRPSQKYSSEEPGRCGRPRGGVGGRSSLMLCIQASFMFAPCAHGRT